MEALFKLIEAVLNQISKHIYQTLRRFLFLCLLLALPDAIQLAQGQESYFARLITPDLALCESGDVEIQIEFNTAIDGPVDVGIEVRGDVTGLLMASPKFVQNYYPATQGAIKTQVHTVDYPDDNEITIKLTTGLDGNGTPYNESDMRGQTVIRIDRIPTAPFNAGDDIVTCGLSTTLNATPGSGNGHTSYLWSGSGGNFSDNSIANPVFTANNEGTYTLTFTQINGVCQANDQVNVTLNGQPAATIDSESTICGSGNATINLTLQGNGPWQARYAAGNQESTLNITSSAYSFSRNITGETEFRLINVTDVNGCVTSYNGEVGSTVVIPDLKVNADAGEYTEVCGDLVELNAAAPGMGIGQWSGDGVFDDTSDPKTGFRISALTTGVVEKDLTWTITNGDCLSSDVVRVKFYKKPETDLFTAGRDTILYNKTDYTLQASLPFGSGVWAVIEGNAVITGINDPTTPISNLRYGLNRLRWTLSNGVCSSVSDDVTITVTGVKHYNGISPNGDGKNDVLVIEGADVVANNELIIFDGRGKVVYQTRDYQNDWGGTDNSGKILPDGYYYFNFRGEGVDIKDYLIIKSSVY